MDLKSYEDVWVATGTMSLTSQIGKLRIQRAGKYARQPTYRITKILMMEPKLVGTLPAEHNHYKTWRDNLRADLLRFGMTLWDLELKEADLDRKLLAGLEAHFKDHLARKHAEREARDAANPTRKEELRAMLRQKSQEKAEEQQQVNRRQEQEAARRRLRRTFKDTSTSGGGTETRTRLVTTRYGRASVPRIITLRTEG
jgi:hypothetical protein